MKTQLVFFFLLLKMLNKAQLQNEFKVHVKVTVGTTMSQSPHEHSLDTPGRHGDRQQEEVDVRQRAERRHFHPLEMFLYHLTDFSQNYDNQTEQKSACFV